MGVTIVTLRVVLTVLLFVLGIAAAILHRLRDGSMSRDEDSRRSAGWRRDRRRIRPALARVADLRRRAGGLMNGRPRHARSRNTTGGTVDVQARATAGRREYGLKVAIMSPWISLTNLLRWARCDGWMLRGAQGEGTRLANT